jgi:hypothetical protein
MFPEANVAASLLPIERASKALTEYREAFAAEAMRAPLLNKDSLHG